MKKVTLMAAAVAMAATAQVATAQTSSDHPEIGPSTMAMAFAHVYANILPSLSITGGSVSGASGTDNYTPVDSNGYPVNDQVHQGTDSGSTAGINWVRNVNLGSHSGTGYIEGWASFVVHANVQEYGIGCSASKLYKGNTPLPTGFEATEHDDPIDVYEEYGCYIDAQNANPVNGGSKYVSFIDQEFISDFDFSVSEIRRFHFNHPEPTQNITLKVKWLQDDPEKRTGQYSGFIKLTAMIDQASSF